MLTKEEKYILHLIIDKNSKKKSTMADLPAHYLKALIRFTLLKKAKSTNEDMSRRKRRLLKENFYRYLISK